jgi:hypothetical protein
MNSAFRKIGSIGLLVLALGNARGFCQDAPAAGFDERLKEAERKLAQKKADDELDLLTLRTAVLNPASVEIYRQASEPYVYLGGKVDGFADGATLARLSQSQDTQCRNIAQELLDIAALGDRNANNADVSGLVQSFQVQLSMYMARAIFSDEYDPEALREFTGRSALHRVQEKMLDVLINERTLTEKMLDVETQVTKGLKERETVSIDPFRQQFFSTTFRVEHPAALTVLLTNKTGESLHHCVIITRMTVNDAAISSAEARQGANEVFAKVFAYGMGADATYLAMQSKLEEASWDLARLDKSTIAYLDEWKPDGTVEAQPASAAEIMSFGKAMTWSMWSDEGYVDGSTLPLDAMKAAIDKEFRPKAQPRSQARASAQRRRRSQPAPEYHRTLVVGRVK